MLLELHAKASRTSGGPPSVESPKSLVTVAKAAGLVCVNVVFRPLELYHLNGLRRSARICALKRSLMVKSLYTEALAR